MTAEPTFDAAERAAIAAEFKRQAAEPVPPDLTQHGCLVLVLAAIGFAVAPSLLRWLGLASLIPVLFGLLGLAAVAGGALYLFGASRRVNTLRDRAERGLTWLVQHPTGGDLLDRQRAAVALIFNASHSEPFRVTPTLDVEATRQRLGDALPYVLGVEGVLREELNIWPVFGGK